MKMITTAIVALFAVAAFANDPATTAPAAGTSAPAATTTPAPTAKTKETKTTKTKETKTTTAAAPTEDCTKLTGDAHKACTDKAAAAAHK